MRSMMIKGRAPKSGRRLSEEEVAQAKGMLLRGDRQHDIAAYFGVNAGRIAELATGARYSSIPPAVSALPLPGPYVFTELWPLVASAVDVRGINLVAAVLAALLEGDK